MDVGPIFCVNLVRCVLMKDQILILAPKINFKRDFVSCQFLGLECMLLCELPHTEFFKDYLVDKIIIEHSCIVG